MKKWESSSMSLVLPCPLEIISIPTDPIHHLKIHELI